jgi:hypothetical protein
MYSVHFKKRLSAAIPHFIIRYFLFDILRFAVPTMCCYIREVQGLWLRLWLRPHTQGSAPPLARKAASQIERETLFQSTDELKDMLSRELIDIQALAGGDKPRRYTKKTGRRYRV